MIFGCLRCDNTYAVMDDDKCYIFDRMGKLVSDKNCPVDVIQHKEPVNVISVLSAGGRYEVCLFDGDTLTRKDGNMQTIASLQAKKGYMHMLRRSGKHEGVRFNQIVFVYNKSVDIGGLL